MAPFSLMICLAYREKTPYGHANMVKNLIFPEGVFNHFICVYDQVADGSKCHPVHELQT